MDFSDYTYFRFPIEQFSTYILGNLYPESLLRIKTNAFGVLFAKFLLQNGSWTRDHTVVFDIWVTEYDAGPIPYNGYVLA